MKTILIATARDPAQAPIFNHASMAHNNHMFFKNIAPSPKPIPPALKEALEASFSSIESLKREFVLTASAMFGPGFVWLIKAGPSDFRILPTYLAGSPYPGAHWRRQGTDMNTTGAAGSAADYLRRSVLGVRGGFSRKKELPPGGIDALPLLCLNTWEHVWLRDYGVGAGGVGGKKAFAEAWWEVIDWEAVASAASVTRSTFK
jgi:superoxide dismutase, Fe-Mn family